ncbi:hypothetical protein BH10PSE14_BH10PSE14_07560 [soil metagenome]
MMSAATFKRQCDRDRIAAPPPTETEEITDDPTLRLQPVPLHPDLPLRDGADDMWLRPFLPLREMRLQEVSAARRRTLAISPEPGISRDTVAPPQAPL